jgi:hypothetical protein
LAIFIPSKSLSIFVKPFILTILKAYLCCWVAAIFSSLKTSSIPVLFDLLAWCFFLQPLENKFTEKTFGLSAK